MPTQSAVVELSAEVAEEIQRVGKTVLQRAHELDMATEEDFYAELRKVNARLDRIEHALGIAAHGKVNFFVGSLS